MRSVVHAVLLSTVLLVPFGASADDLLNANNRVKSLYLDGRYEQGLEAGIKVLRATEEAFGSNHENVTVSLNTLALIYVALGRFADAEPLYKRSLTILDSVPGGQSSQGYAATLGNLADLRMDSNDFVQAEVYYSRSLRLYERGAGLKDPSTAKSRAKLAKAQFAMGLLDEALANAGLALEVLEAGVGPNSRELLETLSTYGLTYLDKGNAASAEVVLKRAVAISLATLGQKHPGSAVHLNNLGSLYAKTGRFVEAERLLRTSHAINLSTFGADHPETKRVAENLMELSRLAERPGSMR